MKRGMSRMTVPDRRCGCNLHKIVGMLSGFEYCQSTLEVSHFGQLIFDTYQSFPDQIIRRYLPVDIKAS